MKFTGSSEKSSNRNKGLIQPACGPMVEWIGNGAGYVFTVARDLSYCAGKCTVVGTDLTNVENLVKIRLKSVNTFEKII